MKLSQHKIIHQHVSLTVIAEDKCACVHLCVCVRSWWRRLRLLIKSGRPKQRNRSKRRRVWSVSASINNFRQLPPHQSHTYTLSHMHWIRNAYTYTQTSMLILVLITAKWKCLTVPNYSSTEHGWPLHSEWVDERVAACSLLVSQWLIARCGLWCDRLQWPVISSYCNMTIALICIRCARQEGRLDTHCTKSLS